MGRKTKVSSFSKAAHLWAKYAAVADSVHQAFLGDVGDFLDDLVPHIKKHVKTKTLRFQEYRATQNPIRSWYIGDPDKHRDFYPQLQFRTDDVEIVSPGRLRFTAVAPRASDAQLEALAKIAAKSKWSNFCQPSTGKNWNLFLFEVEMKAGTDLREIGRLVYDMITDLRTTQLALSRKKSKKNA